MAEVSSDFVVGQKRSFGRAMIDLPGQYVNVLTHPAVKVLRMEKEKGQWSVVWLQLVLLAVVSALIMGGAYLIAPPDVSSAVGSSGMSVHDLQNVVAVTTVVLLLVLTPVAFLLANGILYLLARLSGGKGRYLEQLSVSLLFGVPMVLLSALLSLPPATRNWLPWLPHLYSIVLMMLTMIAVHSRNTA